MSFLDYSRHRVLQMAPLMLEYLGADKFTKITLIHGNYYELPCADEQYDFITMSMALMMAQKPEALMRECYRVLKKGGKIVIVGEPRISSFEFMYVTIVRWYQIARRYIFNEIESESLRAYIERKSLSVDESGANIYALHTYKQLFKKHNFIVEECYKNNPRFWSFVLRKP